MFLLLNTWCSFNKISRYLQITCHWKNEALLGMWINIFTTNESDDSIFLLCSIKTPQSNLRSRKLGMWINGNVLFFFEINVGPFWQLLESAKRHFVNITADLIKLPRNYWNNAWWKPVWKQFYPIRFFLQVPVRYHHQKQERHPYWKKITDPNAQYLHLELKKLQADWYEIFSIIMLTFVSFDCFLI